MPPLFIWSSTHGSKAQLSPRDRYTFNTADTPAQSHKNNTTPKLEFGRSYVSSIFGISVSGQARMVRKGLMMSMIYSFTCLTALALLTGCTADGSLLPETERRFTGRKEQEVNQKQQLNTSALNTALAFGPYRDLATRTTAEPGVQQQQQRNILFSPVGLASALALLSQATGSESRSQALGALGLAVNSTELSVEATISALTNLLRSLTLQEEGAGGGVQRAESDAGAGTEARIGPTARLDVGDGAEDRTGTEDGVGAGGHLRVWSGLHVDGKHSLDYDSFLSGTQHAGPSALNISFETLTKDLQDSDKLELNNYVYFKGSLLLNGC